MRNENMQENFLLSLKEVMRIAGENRNVISSGELEQVFAGQGLTPQQMDAVRAYMADNGIGIDEQVSLEQRISQEEHNYLEEYQALVESIELPSDGVMDAVRLSAMAGEKGAQNDLITYSLRNVLDIARLYAGQGVLLEDLIGAGNEALTIGVTLLGPLEKPSEVDGFLAERVMNAMENLVSLAVDTKAAESRVEARVNLVADKAAELAEALGRPVTPSELAAEGELSEEEIRDILRLSGNAIRDIAKE